MKVSVIIVHYGAADPLVRCLSSLRDELPRESEVLLVNNDHPSALPPRVEKALPSLRIVQLERNVGFAGGCNAGIVSSSGELLFFLNNDAVLTQGSLEALVSATDRLPDHDIFQPCLISFDAPDCFDYSGAAGGMLDRYGYPFCRGRLFDTVERNEHQYEDSVEIFWASGAAMLVRRSLFDLIGRFDEDFFFYMEEIDLCWRAHLAGRRAAFVPGATVLHRGAANLPRSGFRHLFLNHRNNLLMVFRNAAPGIIWRRLLLEGASGAGAALTGRFRRAAAVAAGLLSLAVRPGFVARKRLQTRSHRLSGRSNVDSIVYPRSVALQYFVLQRRRITDLPSFRPLPIVEARGVSSARTE
jgi:GT2 family glycosyltransferase